MNSNRVAAIDCGTNSIRLLISDVGPDGSLTDVDRRMNIVRLGYGVDRTGQLDPEAIDRTLAVAREYAALIDQAGVTPDRIRFAATSATRDARNRDSFVGGIRSILGIEPEVITGAEEARLSFQGAVSTLKDPGPAPRLVVDIGGGSTELVLGSEVPEAEISLDMGSVRLTERYLSADPPSAEDIVLARRDIDTLLDEAAKVIDFSQVCTVVGLAGTVTTLTAIAVGAEQYSPDVTHGARIDVHEMQKLCEDVLSETREQRSRRLAIHPGRVDVIGAGALIYSRVLERARIGENLEVVVTSEHDILDGLAMSVADQI